MQFFEAAIGAYFLETSPPAEKMAKSKPLSKEVSVNSSTTYLFPEIEKTSPAT